LKSLTQRLSVGILVGLGLLWLGIGIAVDFTVRRSLEGRFDAELKAMASEVRFFLPEGRHLQAPKSSAYWFDFFQPDSGLYFEVWDEYLLFSDRSGSLGDRKLPRPATFATTPAIWNFTLASGEKLRGIAQQFAGNGSPDFALNVVVARSRESLDRSIQLLLGATGLVGLLFIPLSFLIVRLAVGRGLEPLRTFAERTAAFDIDSLSERFQTAGVPRELVPISERLNELLQRLAAGIERERRLNQDLSHELRTPVAELRTLAEVALAWPDKINGESYKEVLGAAQQMQSIINGMLTLARWDRAVEAPAKEWVELAGVLESCEASTAAAVAAKRLQVERILAPGMGLHTNPELFRMIVSNLIGNAVEYSPMESTVTIECACKNGGFRLSIANEVNDLEPTDLPHLFERFWRRDTARRTSGHAGLGLPLAKSCAVLLGLNLVAEFKGSPKRIVFSLSIPPKECEGPACASLQ
jgi:two-component system sensor histidine kinase QseC